MSSSIFFAASVVGYLALRQLQGRREEGDVEEWVQRFIDDGVTTINIFSPSDCVSFMSEIESIIEHRTGIKPTFNPPTSLEHMRESAKAITEELSSTNGTGGVMDVHLDQFLDHVRTSPLIWSRIKTIWSATYGSSNPLFPPKFNASWSEGFVKLDRICYRFPTFPSTSKKSFKKSQPTRCLLPHVDTCPSLNLLGDVQSFYRPVQCFLALTDTVLQNKGGFEAALGLHKNFDDWGKKLEDQNVRGCNGNYIGIREKAVYEKIKHVVVKAGDVVVWDERIPHATSKFNFGEVRGAIYLSYLPDCEINRNFKRREWEGWKKGEVWYGEGGGDGVWAERKGWVKEGGRRPERKWKVGVEELLGVGVFDKQNSDEDAR
ncbi:hypothetical protein TrVE_jg1682 [Triparma verrucosa]|uniref:Uncharacterized protein n=1 Tax=Triparma verrucosa TaxID=1606542 RepID=A0A9W7FIN9_9STRA|nr:hypothetical protein TrVE_jg1682 [Triparma verrucosa]